MPIDTANTSPLLPAPHIAVLACAVQQWIHQQKVLTTLCAQKKQSWILRQVETMRTGLANLAAPPELNKWEIDTRIIDIDYVHAWITSPSGQYHQLKIPRELQLGVTHMLNVWGTILNIRKLANNGYNSEFEITPSDGNKWTMIGSIFTTSHPIVLSLKNKQKKLETIQGTINTLTAELGRLKSKLKLLMKKNRERVQEITKQLAGLRGYEASLTNDIWELAKQIPNISKYVSFSYVPYQRVLDTHDTHMEGMRHLSKIMTDAYEHLKSQKRMTVTETKDGKEMTRIIDTSEIHKKAPPELAILLNLVERMDYQVYYKTIPEHREYKLVGKPWKQRTISVHISAQEILRDTNELDTIMATQVGRALTVFGLNRENAYSWQRNIDSWALGLAQLIPSAYRNLQIKYSTLQGKSGVPTEHEVGAKNQRISMQFQIMHLYDEHHQLPSWIRSDWDRIMTDRQAMIWIYSILAAGYNGSMKNTLTESRLNTPWTHKISELYPVNLRHKFAHNRERYTYVLKLEYLFGKYFGEKK